VYGTLLIETVCTHTHTRTHTHSPVRYTVPYGMYSLPAREVRHTNTVCVLQGRGVCMSTLCVWRILQGGVSVRKAWLLGYAHPSVHEDQRHHQHHAHTAAPQ
jgi:hypothetical protein